MAEPSRGLRVGIDENGLGSRLGPMLVTAVAADISEAGAKYLSRGLRGTIRRDLDDSKNLVSHRDFTLGEAWARVLAAAVGAQRPEPQTPAQLFEALSLEAPPALQKRCPSHLRRQCWNVGEESFAAEPALLARLERHRQRLQDRGIRIVAVRLSSLCAQRLNREKAAGGNRFVSDLHAMESLIVSLREQLGRDLVVRCGKVGGISDYSSYFGPLAGRLHTALEVGRGCSRYHFPGLGELAFERDADQRDPLVMLASLVGKYMRELLMARVWRFYPRAIDAEPVSGYHDPRTARWIEETRVARRRLRVLSECFQRN